jgi:predicted DNA-binding transcriptional regulator AlpA
MAREGASKSGVVGAFPQLCPRGLSREQSAAYVGFGVTKFDEMVKDERMPKPKRVDNRLVWDRYALDQAFEELAREDDVNDLEKAKQELDRRLEQT